MTEKPLRGKPASLPDQVDEASDESFPASDPPGWAPLHVGSPEPPADHPADERRDRPEADA